MSRIGKNPITIAEGVTVVQEGTVIMVKGKLGELSQDIDSSVSVTITDKEARNLNVGGEVICHVY